MRTFLILLDSHYEPFTIFVNAAWSNGVACTGVAFFDDKRIAS